MERLPYHAVMNAVSSALHFKTPPLAFADMFACLAYCGNAEAGMVLSAHLPTMLDAIAHETDEAEYRRLSKVAQYTAQVIAHLAA